MDEDLDSLVAAVEAQGIRYVTDTIAGRCIDDGFRILGAGVVVG